MATLSRTAHFTKLQKILRKHYKPAAVQPSRTVVEHLLFACCLEDARHEAAEEAFAALVHTFFDWNEVRVTTISELSEVMACLPDPRLAANRIKRVLHAIFESRFNFDLEDLKKKTLGAAITYLQQLDGTNRFTVAFTLQAGLGGHAIPLDAGTMNVLKLLELVAEKDAAQGVVPGLERAIPKSKGMEFGTLLHQLGADFSANPYASALRAILLEINPAIGSRLPKRRLEPSARKPAEPPPPPTKTKESVKEKGPPSEKAKARGQVPAPPAKKLESAEKSPTKKKESLPPPAENPAETPAKKTRKKTPPLAASAPESPPAAPPRQAAPKKKSVSLGLSKRKPR
jgi:endonuclease III